MTSETIAIEQSPGPHPPAARPTATTAAREALRTARRPIRVLHIIRNLGLGGAETNLLTLASAFDAKRIETHVAYSMGGEIEPRFRSAGLALFRYADADHRVKSLATIAIVLRLARYIRRHRIDVVHTHNFSGHVWGMLAAKLTGVKVVEHVHDFRYTPPAELASRHGWLDQYGFVRYLRGRSDRIVVLTEEHRRFVLAHRYADAGQVVRVPNGIAFDDRPGPAEAATPATGRDETTILTAARMHPSKNIELILRIAAAVRERAPRAAFVVAGSGELLDEYRRRAVDAGIDDFVRFVGFRPDVDALLAEADVFLSPSWLELHSIAILEAMRNRVPVVISRGVGCNDEFIDDGANGFLCDPALDRPWIEALVRLCGEPGLRRRLGDAGYETARRLFDLADTAERFEHLYRDLVDEPEAG